MHPLVLLLFLLYPLRGGRWTGQRVGQIRQYPGFKGGTMGGNRTVP
jgi:hypothetical protein